VDLSSYAVSTRNRITADWQSLLRAGQSEDDTRLESGFGPSRFRTRQDQYLWQNDFTLGIGSLQLALERREERLSSDTPYDLTHRDTNSVVGVYQLRADAHSLQLNLRHDDNSQFGNQNTGALAYGYRFSPAWRMHASAGTGFKAPTFNDLYFPGFSNPNLQPEKARNVELGVHYADSGIGLDAVAYHNRVRDLIVFQCDADFNCAPENVNEARLQGITLSGRTRWESIDVTGSLDLQQPEDQATGHLLPRRARQHGSLTLGQSFGAWDFGAEWIASSRRYDDLDNTRGMGGYGIVNLTATYSWSSAWRLLLRANNVFDKDYELAKDYATPGANIFVAIQYRPGT
jgi:vitamin B12 transporter